MKSKHFRYFKLYMIAGFILLFIGCNGGENDKTTDTVDTSGLIKTNNTEKSDSNQPQKPTSATLMLDISGSMKGIPTVVGEEQRVQLTWDDFNNQVITFVKVDIY